MAFNDTNGSAMDVLLVHGGSFMTEDPGLKNLGLAPGESAVAYLGWNAMAAAGATTVGELLVAPYAGTERYVAPSDPDIVNGAPVSVTAWGPAR